MELTKSKNNQIIQNNKILLGGQTINLRARQLVYVLANLLHKKNPVEEITFEAKDFLVFINNTSGNKWTDIYSLTNDIFDHLNDNPILIKKDRGKDYKKINWLSSLAVENGTIKARFSPDIAYYFAYKKDEPYTKLLWDLRNYKSAHSTRLVDLFQKYHRKESGVSETTFKYDVEELKFFLGVKDKYTKFSDFKRRVLEPTRKELENNDYVPYWFEYEVERRGRAASKVVFTVYVRHQILIDLIPDLRLLENKSKDQTTLFQSASASELSEQKQFVIRGFMANGLDKNYAIKVMANLSESQGLAYLELIKYGVNRSLAFTVIKDHCSFGELKDYEYHYVKHSLEILEKQRLQRINDYQNGKTKKKTTPESKRGGLAKNVFVKQLHFSSFMEKLSSIRNFEENKQVSQTLGREHKGYTYDRSGSQKSSGQINSIGDILKNI